MTAASGRAARRVVVVGGGITGLTVAYRLAAAGGGRFDVTLLEAGERLGGKLAPMTLEGPGGADGLVVEGGADSFVVRKPWAVELCEELGLADELIAPGARGASVWARDRLLPYPERSAFGVPSHVESLLRWPGLSRRGRLRAAMDVYRPRRKGGDDESIGSLIERRMGREAASVLVGPLLAGINSGDPWRLSVRATFPELAEWERVYGSLVRGARAALRPPRDAAPASPGRRAGALFATVRGGFDRLIEALAAAIGPERIHTRDRVERISRGVDGFEVFGDDPSSPAIPADAVVVTTPGDVTAGLIGLLAGDAARELEGIPYGSSAVVALAYPPGTGERLPDSTGFIVPPGSVAGGDPVAITACTWLSRKWPAPETFGDRAVLRAFVGRAGHEEDLARADPELVAAVVRDVERISPVAEMPEAAGVVRWERSMPQYEVGHLERVERIERAIGRVPGLFVAGSAYRGVGIADCIRQANEAAERVRTYLEG